MYIFNLTIVPDGGGEGDEDEAGRNLVWLQASDAHRYIHCNIIVDPEIQHYNIIMQPRISV